MTEVKRSKPNVVHWLVLADSHGVRIDRNCLCVLCIHVDSPDPVCTRSRSSTVPVLLSTFQLFKVLSTLVKSSSHQFCFRTSSSSIFTFFTRLLQPLYYCTSVGLCQEFFRSFLGFQISLSQPFHSATSFSHQAIRRANPL